MIYVMGAEVRADPGRADAYNGLGVLHRIRGDAAGAEENIRAGLRADPEHADEHNGHGVLHWKRGYKAEAEGSLRRRCGRTTNARTRAPASARGGGGVLNDSEDRDASQGGPRPPHRSARHHALSRTM